MLERLGFQWLIRHEPRPQQMMFRFSKLNLLVTAQKENPATVADRWLQQQGLI